MYKWIVKNSVLLISILLVISVLSLRTHGGAIQTLGGLAVAGPNSQWINLQDASVGTPITNGLAAIGPYGYNGTSFDSLRTASVGNNVAATGILASSAYGQYNSTLPTLTTGNYATMQLDSSGRLIFGTSTATIGSVTSVGSKTPTDAYANPTDASDVLSFLVGWNGTAWDRLSSGANNADAEVVKTLGVLSIKNYLYGFNSTSYDRIRSVANNADAVAATTLGNLAQAAYQYVFNGTTWDRVKSTTTPYVGTEAGTAFREVPNRRSRAVINISATGDQTVIAGVGGQTITLYKIIFSAAAANTVIMKDGVAGTAINGAGFALAANGGFVYDGDIDPIILTTANAFVLNNSAATNVSGFVIYSQQ